MPLELRDGDDACKPLNRRKIGAAGEAMAAEFLREKGFTLLEQNFMTKRGEIDIIASKNGVLHFVEVKYRKNLCWGHPGESVTPKKIRRIQMVMNDYLWKKRLSGVPVQIDVIGIVGEEIEWIEAGVLM